MPSEGSITRSIGLLKAGDHVAAEPLWPAYFSRLVALARSRLRDTPLQAADEGDVARSAFDSFCRQAEFGHFPCRARPPVSIAGRSSTAAAWSGGARRHRTASGRCASGTAYCCPSATGPGRPPAEG